VRASYLPVAVLLGACGSDSCPPGSTEIPTEGVLLTAADMPQDGCVAGSLAGIEPWGMWFAEMDNGRPFSGSGPITFAGSCGEPVATTVGRIGNAVPYETTLMNDSYWFWRTRSVISDVELVSAYMVCAIGGGGLRGIRVVCNDSSGESMCVTEQFTLTPFGRTPGEDEADGIELVSEIGGDWPAAFAANVRVRDDVAYLVHGTDGLRIIDVGDIEHPFEIGFFPAESEFFNDIKLADDGNGRLYALVASDARGILVIDVTDPSNPTLATVFTPDGDPQHGVHTLFLDTYQGAPAAFLIDGYSPVLSVYDITDPAAATRVALYSGAEGDAGFHDLFVENAVAYVNATWDGLLVIDPAQAEQPVLASYPSGDYSHSNWITTAGGRRVTVHGGEGFDAHVRIVDVDPASPTYMQAIGEWQNRHEVSVHNIMAVGERAYMAHYEDGLRILDLSDPTQPTQVAYFNSWSPTRSDGSYLQGLAGIDLDLERQLVFASDSQRGLLILRVAK